MRSFACDVRLAWQVDAMFESLSTSVSGGGPPFRDMAWADLPRLTFLTRLITETLRFW